MIEFIGYLGSFLIAASLSLKDLKQLRIVNALGALIFMIYGIIIGSYPIIIMDSYIFFMNIYRLMGEVDTSNTQLEKQPKVD